MRHHGSLNNQRRLILENLERRALFAVLISGQFLTQDFGPVYSEVANAHTEFSAVLYHDGKPNLQHYLIVGEEIQPAAADVVFSLPEGALGAEVKFLLDNDSAAGNVTIDGVQKPILWLEPDRYLVVGTEQVSLLAAVENSDGFFMALLAENFVPTILHVDRNGVTEAFELSTRERVFGAGVINDVPIFVGASETELGFEASYYEVVSYNPIVLEEKKVTLPEGTFLSEIIGIGEMDGVTVFVGNVVSEFGQSTVAVWNAQTGQIAQQVVGQFGQLRVISVSGSVAQVEEFGTRSFVPLDGNSAIYLNSPAFSLVDPKTLIVGNGQYDDLQVNTFIVAGENFIGSFRGVRADGLGIETVVIAATPKDAFQNGFHNYTNRLDVNNDGYVSPLDALLIINALNFGGARHLGISDIVVFAGRYPDVNNDGNLSPIDVLIIINFLNQRSSGGVGEGEIVISLAPAFQYFVAIQIEEKRRNCSLCA